jgi:hypothetical protein
MSLQSCSTKAELVAILNVSGVEVAFPLKLLCFVLWSDVVKHSPVPRERETLGLTKIIKVLL